MNERREALYVVVKFDAELDALRVARIIKQALRGLVEVYTFDEGGFRAHWRPTNDPPLIAPGSYVPGRARSRRPRHDR